METLISYKNSYSDFKQSYQVQLEHAKGQLKYGIRYGENYRLPLDEKKVVFYLSNNDQRMECLLKVMEAFVKFNLDQEYTIKVIFGAKLDKNLIPKVFQKYIEHPSDAEAQEDLATAKYLLSGESLPKYFVRKEGQNVIRFFDEFHKEENNRLELAQNKLSWLIVLLYLQRMQRVPSIYRIIHILWNYKVKLSNFLRILYGRKKKS